MGGVNCIQTFLDFFYIIYKVPYRQETTGSGRWGGFKLETSFYWGTTRICTRAYDLKEGVTSKILKCADDTILFRNIKGNGDKQQLQDDIDTLIKWSEKLQMLFNFEKCKCLHAGHERTWG